MIKKCLILIILVSMIVIQTAMATNNSNETPTPISANEIVIQETESVSLKPIAYDPDDDLVNFTFTSPVNKEGNWQTDYSDAGEYTVTVTASDGELSSSKEVLIIVTKKEAVPTIDFLFPKKNGLTINEGSQIYFNVIASDINKDELSYRWNLDNSEVSKEKSYIYKSNYFDSGIHKIRLDISDNINIISWEWNVSVKNKDRPPSFKPVKTTYMKENEEITLNLDIVDPDEDILEISAKNLPEGAYLSGQEFGWQPGHDTVKKDSLFSKTLSTLNLLYKRFKINFYAKSNDITKKRSLKIWVKDVNRAPQLEYIPPIEINEGESFTIEPIATDPDGDKIGYSFSGWINEKSYTTNYEDAGKYKVRITASDGFLTDTKDVEVIVKDVNRIPELKLKSLDVYEDESLKLEINPIDPDGDFVDISVLDLPKRARFIDNRIEWTPGYDFIEKDKTKNITVKFTLDDGETQSENPVVFVVHDKNREPKIINITPTDNLTVYKNSKVKFKVMVEDPDNDPLQYLWEFSLLEKYNATRTHIRGFSTTGRKKVKVTVSDGQESISYIWNVFVVEKPVAKVQKGAPTKKVVKPKILKKELKLSA